MSHALKRIQELEQVAHFQRVQHIWFHEDHTEVYKSGGNLKYYPSPTAQKLKTAFDDASGVVAGVMGPFGSGKSTMTMHQLVREACLMPVWYNNRRRCRMAFIRNRSE